MSHWAQGTRHEGIGNMQRQSGHGCLSALWHHSPVPCLTLLPNLVARARERPDCLSLLLHLHSQRPPRLSGPKPPSYSQAPNITQKHHPSRTIFRGRDVISRGRETISRGRETTSRGPETMSRGRETTSRGREIVSRGPKTASRGRAVISRGRGTVLCGREIVPRGPGMTRSGHRPIEQRSKRR